MWEPTYDIVKCCSATFVSVSYLLHMQHGVMHEPRINPVVLHHCYVITLPICVRHKFSQLPTQYISLTLMHLAARPTLHMLFEKLLDTVNSASSESGGLNLRLLLNNSRTSSLVYAGTNHLFRLQSTINIYCNQSTAGKRSTC